MFRLSRSRCHQVARVLQSYLDGEADMQTSAMVANHLEECRRCGLEAATYTAIKAAIAAQAPADTIDGAAVERLRRFADELALPHGDDSLSGEGAPDPDLRRPRSGPRLPGPDLSWDQERAFGAEHPGHRPGADRPDDAGRA